MAEIRDPRKNPRLEERRGKCQSDGDDRSAGKAQVEAGMHHSR
jgi:hypothetical protein